jgi:hypothetical protein
MKNVTTNTSSSNNKNPRFPAFAGNDGKQLLKNNIAHFLFFSFIVVLLAACTVRLISPYNAALVSDLNNVQNQVNALLLDIKQNINTSKASYDNYKTQYAQIEAEMITIISNVSAIPKSGVTVKQLKILQHSLAEMEEMHQKGFKSAREVTVIQQTLNDDFTAIYRLQYMKQEYGAKEGAQ